MAAKNLKEEEVSNKKIKKKRKQQIEHDGVSKELVLSSLLRSEVLLRGVQQ